APDGNAGSRTVRLGARRRAAARRHRFRDAAEAARVSPRAARGLMPMARSPADALRLDHPVTLAGVADSAEGLIAADLARAVAAKAGAAPTSLLVVCRDGQRLAQLARGLTFFAPDVAVDQFPAWDCLPYDRVSPHAAIVAQRMIALSRLARTTG